MRIKCGVKAVITFDHTFDTNQRKSKSIFSCSETHSSTPPGISLTLSGEDSAKIHRVEASNWTIYSWVDSIFVLSQDWTQLHTELNLGRIYTESLHEIDKVGYTCLL